MSIGDKVRRVTESKPTIDRRRWRLTAALSEQFKDRERRRRNRRASEIGHRISGWQPAGADERYGVNDVLIPANRVPNSPGKGIRHGTHDVLSLYHQYRSARVTWETSALLLSRRAPGNGSQLAGPSPETVTP